MDEIDKFDAGFFRITPIEARNLDPRHRMLLETSWQALEDAGMDPDRLRGSRTGVYAGIGTSEYRDLMTTTDYGISYLGTAASMAVGRIAFHLGLEGRRSRWNSTVRRHWSPCITRSWVCNEAK